MLLYLAVLATAGLALTPWAAHGKRPNVLFILTDNQAASLLGSYGNSDIRTPNIDRLAREGARFSRAYAVNGMCSPTRATLMTGLMPSQHGIHNWLDDAMLEQWPADWSAIAEFRTLPLTLKNRGYRTALIGKWHLGQPWKPSIGYQHWVTFKDGHTVDFWDNTVIDNARTYRVNDQHIVDFFTEKAVEYIEAQDGEEPFYLQLNYDGPYLNPPTNLGPARNRFYRDYAGREFKSFPRVAFNRNLTEQLLYPDRYAVTPFLLQKFREALEMHNDPATMANVASQNTLVDDGVGKVLAALKRKRLDHNTLVIFSSDQGNFYGQHGLWQHTVVTAPSNLHETAMNIPLILRHPGRIEPGRVLAELIGQYDIPVTLLDYLGIDDASFSGSPGRSFSALLHGEPAPWTDKVFFEQEETRGIRTRRFSYWKRLETTGEPELYDMDTDPGQTRNVYGAAAYADAGARMDKELDAFFRQYSDRQYDLWRGGTAKGSVIRPQVFRRIYGPDWAPETKMLPPFQE
ncbi:MAG: sulfatase-like hydrolase/transferase, partial [Gammaproteobacteria bacterium]|nr:sulfatase-like hydrolase/transferase [Gammaproteobacteria bacterium]